MMTSRKKFLKETEKSPPFTAIRESFALKLALYLIGVLCLGNLLFGGVLWLLSGHGFGPDRLVLSYALYGVFMVPAIALLSVFYSHRVAGPLYRVRQVARDISEGKLYPRVKFRKNDALHPLAGSINSALDRMSFRHELLVGRFNRLETACDRIKSDLRKGRRPEAELFQEINGSREEINKILGEVEI